MPRPRRVQAICQVHSDANDRHTPTRKQSLDKASTAFAGTLGLLSPVLLDVHAAGANDPLLTGKTVSLIHPALMLFLFGSTAWTGWLGFQWRRARTLPAEIKDLKSQLPKPDAEGNRPSSPLQGEIAALEQERKDLLKGDPKGVHHNWGSLLLGLGVLIAVVGPVNTYLRAGKLFPGPHLYAGAGIVVLWALASAMVPYMAKGSEVARTVHITLNFLNLGLFAWQIPTGLEIVQKVWANVAWP